MPSTLLSVTVYAASALQCSSQTLPQQKATSQKPLSFEVVTIKPSNPASGLHPEIATEALKKLE